MLRSSFRSFLVLFTLLGCGNKVDGTASGSASAAASAPAPAAAPAAVCKHLAQVAASTKESECIDSYELLQKLDPKGWGCLGGCASTVKTAEELASCEEVCAKRSPDLRAMLDVKKREAEFGGDGMAAMDWDLTKDLLVGNKELKGALQAEGGLVKFKITVHEDTVAPTEVSSSAQFALDAKKHDTSVVNAPLLTVDLRQGTSKEVLETILSSVDPSAKVEKKSSDDGGYVAHVVEESALHVYTGKQASGKLLACEALLAGKAAVIKKAEALPALEKLCKSAVLE